MTVYTDISLVLTVDTNMSGADCILTPLVLKVPVFCATPSFSALFTTARHVSCHSANWMQSTPSPLRAERSGDRVPVGGEIFRSRTHRPWDPPSLLYNGYRVSYPGVKRPGRGADHPPHLEEVSRAIPLLALWAFMACCRVNFTTPSHPITFINVNIILPPTTKSSKWCHSFTFPHQNPVICVTRPAQLIFLD